jgi:hypothetical protein
MKAEPREFMAGCAWGLGGGSGLAWGGDVMDRQGIAWDVTFRDSG